MVTYRLRAVMPLGVYRKNRRVRDDYTARTRR